MLFIIFIIFYLAPFISLPRVPTYSKIKVNKNIFVLQRSTGRGNLAKSLITSLIWQATSIGLPIFDMYNIMKWDLNKLKVSYIQGHFLGSLSQKAGSHLAVFFNKLQVSKLQSDMMV